MKMDCHTSQTDTVMAQNDAIIKDIDALVE